MALIISYETHIPIIKNATEQSIEQALVACGIKAKHYAREASLPADTHTLYRSIDYEVDVGSKTVTVSPAVDYALYVEMGTGAENVAGGTPKRHWVYQDAGGTWHHGRPQKGRGFIKCCFADHVSEYEQICRTLIHP